MSTPDMSSSIPPSSGPVADADVRDWIAETKDSIKARLDGAKAAQSQARVAIVALSVISLMMLTTSYNAYLSYDSEWVRKEALAAHDHPLPAEIQHTFDLLRDEEIKGWASGQQVQISLLGVHVSVDDAPVVGTFALAVVALWLLLLMRRENFTIGFLLRDTDSLTVSKYGPVSSPADHRSLQWLIFHTIASNSTFVAFDDTMKRVDDLNGESQPFVVESRPGLGGRVHHLAFGFARRFFFLFPVVASLIVECLDIWGYFRPDPFEGMQMAGWNQQFLYESALTFLVCWIPLVYCLLKSIRYSMATERVLHQYGDKLRVGLARA
jgi:hypothetical protein